MATVGRVERPSDAMVRLASQKMPSRNPSWTGHTLDEGSDNGAMWR